MIQIIGNIVIKRDHQIGERKQNKGDGYERMSPNAVRPNSIGFFSTQQEDPDGAESIGDPGDENEHIGQHIE